MSNYYHEKWREIHNKALRAETPDQKAEYCRYLRNFASIFPCGNCRAHFKMYLDTNPPERCTDMFIWSWEFHNHVNHRLHKPSLDLFTARSLYK